ncbi:MAG: hypothetical protein KDE27_03910, partial [Planctomycetes bacterium]|nr:hypothetical protein [Planctomycetota bacterium]
MPPLARLAAALKVGLLAALLAAAGCGQNFLQNSQEEDGHWSAARFGGQPEADLQVTAWIVLAYLGDGSTIRSGKFREVLKPAVVWLRRQQDDAGRFGLRGDPGWVFDHALVTFAFAEVIRLSPSKLLGPPTARAAAVLAREIEVMRPEVSAEIRLFARMTVTSLRAGAEAGGDAVITAAEELDDVLAALEPVELVTDRDRAAADLLAAQRGESVAEPAKKGEDGETDLP